ncbi:hypothetical protein GCM10023238_17520 [Streptomyces heliomycini]
MLQPSSKSKRAPAAGADVTGRAWLMLALATAGFALNFWAWALLSPLAPRLKDSLHLSSFQQSLLVAVPVVVGSLGRVPVGALTDRFGGRVMFPLVSAATIVPCSTWAWPGTPRSPRCWSAASSSASAAPPSPSACRSSAPGSRPNAGAWPSASSAPAWAVPRSAPSPRSSWSTRTERPTRS